jgi:hypothetical protein
LVVHDIHHPAKTARKLQLILRDEGINAVGPMASSTKVEHEEIS